MDAKELDIYKERTLIVGEILGAYMHVRDTDYIEAEYSIASWDQKTGTLTLTDKETGLPKMMAFYSKKEDKWIGLPLPPGSPGLTELDVTNFQNLLPQIEQEIIQKYPLDTKESSNNEPENSNDFDNSL